MIIKFSESQIAVAEFWFDPMIKIYLQIRYGHSWLWYWINYEVNHEIVL